MSRGLPRNRAGMIWSVSRLGWSMGIATAVSVVKGSMRILLGQQPAHVGEMAGDGRRDSHRRAEQVGAHAAALAADEVAVRGRGDALAGEAGIAVHADAHRAARLAPFEAGLAEDLVESLRLGLLLDQAGARDHPRRD